MLKVGFRLIKARSLLQARAADTRAETTEDRKTPQFIV